MSNRDVDCDEPCETEGCTSVCLREQEHPGMHMGRTCDHSWGDPWVAASQLDGTSAQRRRAIRGSVEPAETVGPLDVEEAFGRVTHPDGISPRMTLAEAQDWLMARLDNGVRCPCCTQRAQVYRWSLYSTAVRALAWFYMLGGTTEYVHVSRLKERGHKGQGDASRLNYWQLVEEERRIRPDGGRAGYWRVTPLGRAFLFNETTVSKYLWVFDSEVLRRSSEQVNVVEAGGKNFDLQEMLNAASGPSAATG